ncbi:MAG TPA: hypothetical protein VFE33_08735 [Thermoanaerobaculia bacterium]|nr:hypothetical protein [Thermoanaerobaculia bacterium]
MSARKPWWILTVALSSFPLVAPVHPAAAAAAAEEKLAAPNLLSPLPGSHLAFANPAFFWAPVEGAAAYVVELCRDEPCGTLLDRAVLDASPLGNEPQWRPKPLATGTLYWRVTARSRSGLDGQPTGAGRLDLLADQLDHEPPVAKLALTGPQAQVGGRLFTAPAPGFEVSAQDSGCGLYVASPSVDGSVETPEDHTVRGYAIDRCGNRVDLSPIPFTVDAEAPAVRWALVDAPKAVHGDTAAPQETGLYGSADGRKWQPLWRPGQAKAASAAPEAGTGTEIAGNRLFLTARGVKLTIDGQTVAPTAGQLLAVTAEDAGAGVGKLRFSTPAASPGGAPTLEIEAVDRVGNLRKVAWPLVLP